MAKPLQLDVLGEDRSAKRVLKDTADGLDRVADKADDADTNLRDAAGGAGKLTSEIAKTEQAIKKLSAEFDRTGDRGLFKQLSKQQRELSTMLKLRDQLDAPTIKMGQLDGDLDRSARHLETKLVDSVDKAAPRITGRVAGIFSSAMGALPPMVQGSVTAALVGAVAVAAPLAGGALGAGLIAGVGSAGIGVGIAAALQSDPAVASAIGGVGERLKTKLGEALGGEFAGPTVTSVERLGTAAERLLDQTKDEIGALAPVMVQLADGAGEMVERLGPGLEDALRAAGPMLQVLARELPELGDDLSDFFSTVSEGSNGQMLALVTILDLTGAAVKNLGGTIYALSVGYELLIGGTREITRLLAGLTDVIPGVAEATGWLDDKFAGLMEDAGVLDRDTEKLIDTTDNLALEQERAAKAASDHADKLQLLAGTGQDLRLATLDFKDGLAELTESVERNGTSLNINSEKGRNNLRVIESLITGADRAGKAAEQRALAEGKSAEDAAKAGARMRETYIKDLEAAARKAGLSEGKIKDMVRELREADGQRARMYIDVSMGQGVGQAAARAVKAGAKGMSTGGPVGGGGPAGVDSQLRTLASDEWVATGRAHQALLSAYGPGGLEQLNRTGTLPSGGAAAAAATFGGAAAGSAAGGGPLEVVVRAILQWPDGSVITEQVTQHANKSGQRSLESLFGLPAAA
ncbi:hypothetical protein [Micromonospora aurantiaca (nom. illeg.)]|uniref:hypothetical protein n=1 Tax=Micromonospora aurantiaca (nom. illeg.) TaxID=47850 RepID=UPI003F4A1DE3